MKILISGGHVTPAISLIEHTQTLSQPPTIVFVGRVYSQANQQQLSTEFEQVSARGVKFIPLSTGKFAQRNLTQIIQQSLLFIGGFLKSFLIVGKEQPDVFLSFGGYMAVPLALASWLWGIPIVTHEQTRTVGLANSFIARLAKAVAISYPETRSNFPSDKLTLTGNPIRTTVLSQNAPQPSWYSTTDKLPILYITGGSQGSEVINAVVSQTIKQISKSWIVIHQCGLSTLQRNYIQELTGVKAELPRTQQNHYMIREWVSETELAWIYSHATGAVSRAGANTAEELAQRCVPTIFIPLPFAHNQEQLENARALAEVGGAVILPQKDLSPESLQEKLTDLLAHAGKMRKKLTTLTHKTSAAAQLWKVVLRSATP